MIDITGTGVYYGAGGHGGTEDGNTESSNGGSVLPGVSGGANTGAGGGGNSDGSPTTKGNGGSGIVVIRYAI